MIKAAVFDFDGVILESAHIKTMAFRELFSNLDREKTGQIVDYHLRNMGISRFVKFRHIYENIICMPYSAEDERTLAARFSEITRKKVMEAPFVPGALEFIRENHNKMGLFIASGTPEGELIDIMEKRRIRRFFLKIGGSPKEKPEIINEIVQEHSLNREEISFGGIKSLFPGMHLAIIKTAADFRNSLE